MNTATADMVTADGVPLKVSLARARRRSRNHAMLLVAPLLVFILVTFFIPIFSMLFRSVENSLVADTLPRTVPLLAAWDAGGDALPDEAVFAALAEDLLEASRNKTAGRIGRRLNYEKSGFSSLFRSSARKAKRLEPPYKAALIEAHKGWGDVDNWRVLKRESGRYTKSYYLAALDFSHDAAGAVVRQPDEKKIGRAHV